MQTEPFGPLILSIMEERELLVECATVPVNLYH